MKPFEFLILVGVWILVGAWASEIFVKAVQ